jgi:hypothetical protein
VKEFTLELVTITIGVLIALSLGGLVEWRHERVLVREAQENLRQEIADNQRELAKALADLPAKQTNVEHVLGVVDDLLASKKIDVTDLTLSLSMPDLSDASWQTADRTGALGHMTYADVERYAQVYSLQTIVTDEQARLLQQLTSALALIVNTDPTTSSRPDLESLRSRLLELHAQLFVHQQLAQKLLDRYAHVLH